jgi:hypothetical protein
MPKKYICFYAATSANIHDMLIARALNQTWWTFLETSAHVTDSTKYRLPELQEVLIQLSRHIMYSRPPPPPPSFCFGTPTEAHKY